MLGRLCSPDIRTSELRTKKAVVLDAKKYVDRQALVLLGNATRPIDGVSCAKNLICPARHLLLRLRQVVVCGISGVRFSFLPYR
jgi:hypothetical protein